MQYNTLRNKLAIPEYGRHIQQMVDFCKTITDDDKRNQHAQSIINLMGIMNPHLRDVPDFQHKLWDQLFIMSDFDLDVQSPYPILSKEEIYKKPERLDYPQTNYSHKYYGKIIREMIQKLSNWEEGEKKELLLKALANQMKKAYIKWNRDQVDDKIILMHLEDISEGKIKVNSEMILMQVAPTVNKDKKNIVQNRTNNRPQQKTKKF